MTGFCINSAEPLVLLPQC